MDSVKAAAFNATPDPQLGAHLQPGATDEFAPAIEMLRAMQSEHPLGATEDSIGATPVLRATDSRNITVDDVVEARPQGLLLPQSEPLSGVELVGNQMPTRFVSQRFMVDDDTLRAASVHRVNPLVKAHRALQVIQMPQLDDLDDGAAEGPPSAPLTRANSYFDVMTPEWEGETTASLPAGISNASRGIQQVALRSSAFLVDGGVEVSSSQSTQQKLNADDAAIKGRDDDYMTALATAGYQPNFEERASVSFGALAGARESVIDDAFFASKGVPSLRDRDYLEAVTVDVSNTGAGRNRLDGSSIPATTALTSAAVGRATATMEVAVFDDLIEYLDAIGADHPVNQALAASNTRDSDLDSAGLEQFTPSSTAYGAVNPMPAGDLGAFRINPVELHAAESAFRARRGLPGGFEGDEEYMLTATAARQQQAGNAPDDGEYLLTDGQAANQTAARRVQAETGDEYMLTDATGVRSAGKATNNVQFTEDAEYLMTDGASTNVAGRAFNSSHPEDEEYLTTDGAGTNVAGRAANGFHPEDEEYLMTDGACQQRRRASSQRFPPRGRGVPYD